MGNPLQYACLENPMDRGVWRATVHGVTEGQTRQHAHTMTCSWCSMSLVSLLSLASRASPTWSGEKPKVRLWPSKPWTRHRGLPGRRVTVQWRRADPFDQWSFASLSSHSGSPGALFPQMRHAAEMSCD